MKNWIKAVASVIVILAVAFLIVFVVLLYPPIFLFACAGSLFIMLVHTVKEHYDMNDAWERKNNIDKTNKLS